MNQNIERMTFKRKFKALEDYLLDVNNIFMLSDLEDFYPTFGDGTSFIRNTPLLAIVAVHCSKKATEALVQKGVNINKIYAHYSSQKNVFYFLFKHFFNTCDIIGPGLWEFDNVLRAIKYLLEIAQDAGIQPDLSPQHIFFIPKDTAVYVAGYGGVNIYNYSPLQLIARLPTTERDTIKNKELVTDIVSIIKLLLSSGQDILYKNYEPRTFLSKLAKPFQQLMNGIELSNATVFEKVSEPAIMDALINYSPQKTLFNYKNKNLLINVSSKIIVEDPSTFFAFKQSFFGLAFKIKAAKEFLSEALSVYKKENINIREEIAIFLAQYLSCDDAENLGKVNKVISQATKTPLMYSNLAENESASKKFRELALKRNASVERFL